MSDEAPYSSMLALTRLNDGLHHCQPRLHYPRFDVFGGDFFAFAFPTGGLTEDFLSLRSSSMTPRIALSLLGLSDCPVSS